MEPVAATQHTAAGAKAFAEFFIKTIDWGHATMSAAYMRHFSAASCVSCTGIAHDIDAARSAGHTYIGGRSHVTSVRDARPGVTSPQIVSVRSTSFEEVDASGHGVAADPAYSTLSYEVSLEWSSGAWHVAQLRITQIVPVA